VFDESGKRLGAVAPYTAFTSVDDPRDAAWKDRVMEERWMAITRWRRRHMVSACHTPEEAARLLGSTAHVA